MEKMTEQLRTCASIDQYVYGIGVFNSTAARHSVTAMTKNPGLLWATKHSWASWQRLSTHSDKFFDVFAVIKIAAATIGDFMEAYFDRPRKYHLGADDEYNWSTIPRVIDHLLSRFKLMKTIAEGNVERYELVYAMLEEADFLVMTPTDLEFIKKKDAGCYQLLVWIRGSALRKFAKERLRTVADQRLRRLALDASMKFVSKIMREHTPLYYVSGKTWINVVDADASGSDDEDDDNEHSSDSDSISSSDFSDFSDPGNGDNITGRPLSRMSRVSFADEAMLSRPRSRLEDSRPGSRGSTSRPGSRGNSRAGILKK